MVKGNMTKEQALEALKEGKKVCRTYFSMEEYIEMRDGVMYFEDGVLVQSSHDDWWNNIEPTFSKSDDNLDWYLFKE